MRRMKFDSAGKKSRIIRSMTFAGVVTAGLMFGCSRPEPAAVPQQAPAVVDVQKGVSQTQTYNADTEIFEGKRYSFSRSKEAPFAFSVTELGDETADLDFELGTVMPSLNIVSQSFRFSGVTVPRDKVNNVIRRMWNESENPLSKGGLLVVERESAKAPRNALEDGVVSVDRANAEPVRKAIEALVYLVDGAKASSIRVIGSGSDSYLIETVSKQGKRRFRLEKKMGLSIEFQYEKAGYTRMDFLIKRLATDSEGRLSAEYGPDCDGRVETEMFMSEHASGRMRDIVEGCR